LPIIFLEINEPGTANSGGMVTTKAIKVAGASGKASAISGALA